MSNAMLIHVRANPRFGTGRLLRSLTLAKHWIDAGGSVTFAAGSLPRILLRQIAVAGCDAAYLDESLDDEPFTDQLLRLAQSYDASSIVVDASSEDRIRLLADRKSADHQLLVLGKTDCQGVEISTGTHPSLALIRRNLEQHPPSRLTRRRMPQRVLLELSKVDRHKTAEIANLLCKKFVGTNVVFDIVTPFAKSANEQFRRQKAPIRDQVFWHPNSDRAFYSLFAFHLAVVSDAEEFFEIAHSRTAAILLSPNKSWRSLQSLTTAPWMLDVDDSVWSETICDTVANFLADVSKLKKHAYQMRSLVDDQGAARLVAGLQQKQASGGIHRARSA